MERQTWPHEQVWLVLCDSICRAIQAAMPRIYNRMAGEATTENVLIVEDDVIPPLDAAERLMRGFDESVARVSGAYRIAPPQPPRETIQVKAVRPDRDGLEIRFPRVEGYRVELPEERLAAEFNDDSILVLTPELVGPSITRNSGIIGESVDLDLEHLGDTVCSEWTRMTS
jgi:hypothetical protein